MAPIIKGLCIRVYFYEHGDFVLCSLELQKRFVYVLVELTRELLHFLVELPVRMVEEFINAELLALPLRYLVTNGG